MLALIILLLINPALGAVRAAHPLIALDVSLSWTRAADASAWERARQRAVDAAADSVVLVGHEVRVGRPPELPADTAALVARAVEMAQLAGRPLHFISDGESELAGEDLQTRLPAGSRVVVESVERRPDLAVTAFEGAAGGRVGDTLAVRISITAAAVVPTDASLTLYLDGREVLRRALSRFQPLERRSERVALVLPPGPPEATLSAIVQAADDGEPRNDTAHRNLRRGDRITALAISTSPDVDFREMVRVLRGSLSLPTSARFRIGPGRWVDAASTPVAEAQVASELAGAHVVLLHGDTAFFGSPRERTRGALALVPSTPDDAEWYVIGAPPSPLAHVLAALPFDSLPPVAVGPAGRGAPLLEVRGPGRERRALATFDDSAHRVVVAPVRGTYRWAMRGGVAADAFAALWGSIFAVLAERPGVGLVAAPPRLPPRELHPRASSLRTVSISGATRGGNRPLRSSPWPYALVVLLLCAEWVVRRRAGLR